MKTNFGLAGGLMLCFAVVLLVMDIGGTNSPAAAANDAMEELTLDGRYFYSEDDLAYYIHRRDHGHHDVVWMNGLVQDFRNEVISEEDLFNEIDAHLPGLVAALLDASGGVNECFLHNVIGAMAVHQVGSLDVVLYESAQYLDEFGQVIPGHERDYNSARRANAILEIVIPARGSHCMISCSATNHQCCKLLQSGLYRCDEKNLARCVLNAYQTCGNNCTHCG